MGKTGRDRLAAAAVLALDVAKGAAAVAARRALDAPPAVLGACALAAVLGHVFPVFLGFRGGKGVATAAGAIGAMSPAPMLAAVLGFGLTVAWKRYVSLGSMLAVASFPLFAYLFGKLFYCITAGYPATEKGKGHADLLVEFWTLPPCLGKSSHITGFSYKY